MASNLFSVAALFIMFREALEAAIIISIMLQLCTRLKLNKLKKWVWVGALSGCAVAIVIGIIFICIFYIAQNAVFSGQGKAIFTGFVTLLASYLITLLAFAMLKFKNYEKKWEMKLAGATATQATSRDAISGIFLLAFTTTIREGIEAVVFLAGVSAGTPASSIPIPGVIGIIMGVSVGLALYWTGKTISDISWFMFCMVGLLFILGAGLTGRAIVSFQTIGWFGYYGQPTSAQPWQNQQLWNWSACCSEDISKNVFFGILYAIFGYTDSGTAIFLFAYFGYWLEVAFALTIRGARGELLTSKTLRIEEAVNKNKISPPVPNPKEAEACSSSGGGSGRSSPDLAMMKAMTQPDEEDPKVQAHIDRAGSSFASPFEVHQPGNGKAAMV